jgi:hypothetical protein
MSETNFSINAYLDPKTFEVPAKETQKNLKKHQVHF